MVQSMRRLMLVWVAASAVACSDRNSATGPSGGNPAPMQTIVEVTAARVQTSPVVLEQSVAVTGGSFNDIRFRWQVPTGGEPVTGNLYILTQEYLGEASGVNPAMPGFLARSVRVEAGDYVFDSGVTLRGGTTYWFVTDRTVGFFSSQGDTDVYPGGDLYTAGLGDVFHRFYVINPSQRIDANFKLTGKVVPVQ